jgi:hypothetical protein
MTQTAREIIMNFGGSVIRGEDNVDGCLLALHTMILEEFRKCSSLNDAIVKIASLFGKDK